MRFFSRSHHPIHHARVGEHAGVAHFDGRAFSQAHFHAGLGRIAGAGHIYGQAEIRVNAKGGRGGAADAHFFLSAENEKDLVRRIFELAQRLDQNRRANAVIHRFGHHALAQVYEGPVKGGHIAHAHGVILARAAAHVNEKLLEGRDFGPVFQGVAADHALGAVHKAHPPAHAGVRAHTAKRGEAHKAFLVHVGGNHADLVNVRGQHDPAAARLERAFADDQIAKRIHLDLVSVRLNFSAHHGADLSLIARGAVGFN